jgi:23S rRNA (cytidine1920-2'-O)/16S rRNA (cytidine1409-2'-O)-methyltransferase
MSALKRSATAHVSSLHSHVFSLAKVDASLSAVKVRIDKLMVERGLVPSRERAQALIIAGRVMADEQKVTKSGATVDEAAEIRLLGEDLKYVSRGGLKLEHAFDHWKIEVTGKRCADVGASTGGFTDCMLQQGASSVLAIDTGYGQISSKLRDDPRVTLMERTNARYLTPQDAPAVDFVAMDVSFISATLVLPAVLASLVREKAELVVLVKPQFEAGREAIGKGGIVRDEAAQLAAADKVRQAVAGLGGTEIEVIDSPILGAEGNREFLLHAIVRRSA